MGSKTRLSSYCTKRGNNTVNLVTSRKINTRLAVTSTQNLKKIRAAVREKKSKMGYYIVIYSFTL